MVLDAIHAKGIIVDFMHSPERVQILRENVCHWFSCLYVTLDLLSNMGTEAGTNLLAPAISEAVRQGIVGKLRPILAEHVRDVLLVKILSNFRDNISL